MIRIDLLPKEERVRRRAVAVPTPKVKVPFRAGALVWVIVTLVVAFLMVFFYAKQKMEMNRLNSEVAKMRAELTELAREVEIVNELTQRQAEMERWLAVIEELNKNRFLRAHLLDELASLLPDYSWLSSLTESDLAVTIEGRAFSNLIVADLMLRLMASPYFQNVDLSLVKRGTVEEHDVMDFKLTTTLVPYQPPAETSPGASESPEEGE